VIWTARVTLDDIDAALGDAFTQPPVHRDELFHSARRRNCRPEVLHLIAQLPGSEYHSLTEVRARLRDIVG